MSSHSLLGVGWGTDFAKSAACGGGIVALFGGLNVVVFWEGVPGGNVLAMKISWILGLP